MPTEIARLDLHNRRRATIAYAVAMALYTLVIAALYPHDSRRQATLVAVGWRGPAASCGAPVGEPIRSLAQPRQSSATSIECSP